MKSNIGLIDSGIGGVTVLKKCIKFVDNFHYIYYSDSFNNPYGDRDVNDLIEIVDKIVKKLIKLDCYIIILACNTASAVCVDYLRNRYKNVVFIAIEPAIKVASDADKVNNILIMATKGTIDSERFNKLYNKYNYNNFYLEPCVGLANLIEDNDEMKIKEYLDLHIKKYKGKILYIVLGCTHYPIIKNQLRKVLGDIVFYDGSLGVAKQLKRIIKNNNYEQISGFEISFIDSSGDKFKEKRFYELLKNDI